eukprot:scaffold869_cov188-Prasinococcus_capsulatus_cf.AAC.1
MEEEEEEGAGQITHVVAVTIASRAAAAAVAVTIAPPRPQQVLREGARVRAHRGEAVAAHHHELRDAPARR